MLEDEKPQFMILAGAVICAPPGMATTIKLSEIDYPLFDKRDDALKYLSDQDKDVPDVVAPSPVKPNTPVSNNIVFPTNVEPTGLDFHSQPPARQDTNRGNFNFKAPQE